MPLADQLLYLMTLSMSARIWSRSVNRSSTCMCSIREAASLIEVDKNGRDGGLAEKNDSGRRIASDAVSA